MRELTPDAGNGLIGRRAFVRGGALASAGLLAAGAVASQTRPAWMQQPGPGTSGSSPRSEHEGYIQRLQTGSQPGTTGSGASRTPLQYLDGVITPSHLHFERHHSGIPNIDPAQHKLLIHGLVERPLLFSLDTLHRYPMVSRIQFLECSGNSSILTADNPVQAPVGALHGLVSGSEWGGVPLQYLLEEARISPRGTWLIAGGADSAAMNRSIPMEKILDDAIVALYQNGERLRPAQGYPMRLFLPGWEGNASVKWLRSLYVADQPAMTRDATSRFTMGVKSVITTPSPGLDLGRFGVYQVSGIAWSGAGRVRRVEVSADGGKTWADAELDATVLPRALTRFRSAWDWRGQPGVLVSRATDELGHVQPVRAQVMRERAAGAFYHYNARQAWAVSANGTLRNVHV